MLKNLDNLYLLAQNFLVQILFLLANLVQTMAAYKVPRAVEFRDALPRSATGKVMWRALQEAEYDNSGAGAPA